MANNFKPVRLPSQPILPRAFSALSQAEEVTVGETRHGIVFENLDQLKAALRRFDIGPKALRDKRIDRFTMTRDYIRDMQLLREAADPSAEIVRAVKERYNVPGRYGLYGAASDHVENQSHHFGIVKVDYKYVMSLGIMGKGPLTEEVVAQEMGTHLALTMAYVTVRYNPVDSIWFNIDLGPYAQMLGLNPRTIERILAQLSQDDSWHRTIALPPHNTARVKSLHMYLNPTSVFYEYEKGQAFLLAGTHGTRIFGASWLRYRPQAKNATTEFVLPKTELLTLNLALPRIFPDGFGPKEAELISKMDDSVPVKGKIDMVISLRDRLAERIRDELLRR